MCSIECGRGSAIGTCVGFVVVVSLLSWCLLPSPAAAQPAPQQRDAKGKDKEKSAPKQPPEPAWKVALVRDYGLKADEVLRRVAAPFPPSRKAFLQSLKADLFTDSNVDEDEIAANYRWDGKNLAAGSITLRSDKQIGWPLMGVLADLGIRSQDVEGDEDIRQQHIDGEFVVRVGAPADKVLPKLEQILRDELKIPIRFKLTQAEREVFVVGGKYESKPLEKREANEVDLYAVSLNEDSGSGGGTGTFDEFVAATGTYIGRRLVNELPKSPVGRITWYYHNSQRVLPGPDPNQDPEGVLKNVTAQTGLTFKTDKRKVRVLLVEKE